MSEPETVTLPRSGVVMTLQTTYEGGLREYADTTWCARAYVRGECWRVYCVDQDEDFPTEAEGIAWLDARVLALRAALMPADARERVARVIIDQFFYGEVVTEAERRYVLKVANAALAALGIGGAS